MSSRPGGTNADLTSSGVALIRELMANIRDAFPALVELYDNTTSLQDRTVGTGVLRPELARQYGCGGYIGRASGRSFDARRDFAYAPYDQLEFETPVLHEGDVNARVWIRIREVEQSLRLIHQILDRMPSGEIRAEVAGAGEPREGLALRRELSRRHSGLGSAGRGRRRRALPPARPVVVSMASFGSGDRGQYRGGFSNLQQILQLLLFRARPLGLDHAQNSV